MFMRGATDMTIRQKYSPDQRLLGIFVDGLPKTVEEIPVPLKEGEEDKKRGYYSQSESGEGIYAYNDMINSAVEVMWTVNGIRVLVCPTCKKDVELVAVKRFESYKRPSDAIVLNNPEPSDDIGSLCECLVCKGRFFLPELVAQKSFRLAMGKEDISSYSKYLSCVFLKGQWRVLIGNAVSDVTAVATGKSWVDS